MKLIVGDKSIENPSRLDLEIEFSQVLFRRKENVLVKLENEPETLQFKWNRHTGLEVFWTKSPAKILVNKSPIRSFESARGLFIDFGRGKDISGKILWAPEGENLWADRIKTCKLAGDIFSLYFVLFGIIWSILFKDIMFVLGIIWALGWSLTKEALPEVMYEEIIRDEYLKSPYDQLPSRLLIFAGFSVLITVLGLIFGL